MIKSWNDVSINLFRKMRNVPQDEDYTFNLVALLSGKSLKEVLEQPLSITSDEVRNLVFINERPKTHMMKLRYRIGKTVYIPQLDLTNLTTAQYVDFQCLPNKEDSIVETLACVLIPEGKKYNTDYDKDEAMKEIAEYMNIEDALTVCGFFTKWSEVLQRKVLKTLKKQFKRNIAEAMKEAPTKEMKKELKRAYREFSSLGWEQLMQYLNSQGLVGNESTNIR